MKKVIQTGFAHVGIFVVVAVVAISGVLVWVYLNKSAPLATKDSQITTTGQAISTTRQVKNDIENINIDNQLDTSEIDSVLQ